MINDSRVHDRKVCKGCKLLLVSKIFGVCAADLGMLGWLAKAAL